MKKRRKQRYEIRKRCRCVNLDRCDHHWWLRVHAAGTRQRVNLTLRYALALPMARVDVEQWAAKAKHDARHGLLTGTTPRDLQRLTFSDVIDRYIGAHAERAHYYLMGLRQISVPAASGATVPLGSKALDDITTADIKSAVASWRSRKRTRAGAKGGAVAERHLKQATRHLFHWAVREGYTDKTPFKSPQGVSLISIKGTKGRKRRLEAGEELRILAVADQFIKDFLVAMVETGCRPGELRTLQWSEVKDDHFVILATKAKDRDERDVPIMPTLAAILKRRQVGPDGSTLATDAFVFGNEVGEELTRRRLCGRWLDVCQRAGVKDLHLHDLRREAASQLLESGAKIHEVRDVLGHSNTTMTSTYLGLQRDSLTKVFKQRHAHQARQAMRLAHAGQSTGRRKSS